MENFNKLKAKLIVVALFFCANCAYAYDSPKDGAWLLHSCQMAISILNKNTPPASNQEEAVYGIMHLGICTGFLMAVNDSNTLMLKHQLTKTSLQYCPPSNLQPEQETNIVVKYLEDKLQNAPDKLKLPAYTLTFLALDNEFPCKN